MIKLKSLFRRGQGGPAGSSKQSNNNQNKSESTSSLNTFHSITNDETTETNLYPTSSNIECSSERGVDVGVENWQAHSSLATGQNQGSLYQNIAYSNTLPHKKRDKKGQKLPKQAAPLIPNTKLEIDTTQACNDQIAVNIKPQPSQTQSYVMTTIASYGASNTNSNVANSSKIISSTSNESSKDELYKINSITTPAPNLESYSKSHSILDESEEKPDNHTQLEALLSEKLALKLRVNELMSCQNEIAALKLDNVKMQTQNEKNQMEIANLKYENETLRNRLRDVVNSPLSDAEKHQIIQDSQRLHSSAPASIAMPNSIIEPDGLNVAPSISADWDKHSSSSEISVACLQDKIIQMEETHYSTNEELQATLQELADLQIQLSDSQADNERLSEEKDVLFQSLCRQTDKLKEALNQVSSLQQLCDSAQQAAEAAGVSSEREKKLLDLLQNSQKERDEIGLKQAEQKNEITQLNETLENVSRQRLVLLESTSSERQKMEENALENHAKISQQAIEIRHLNTLLENAKLKIDELEQGASRENTGDAMEEKVVELQELCSRQQIEIRRLRDKFSSLNDECNAIKNNAKCETSHLKYLLSQVQQDKDKIFADYQLLVDSSTAMQVQSKCVIEEKSKLQNLLNENQKQLSIIQKKQSSTEEKLEQEIKKRKQEAEEWQQFQSDLLMTVRVANDFKNEALSAREQLVLDNKIQMERIRILELQIEKLNKQQVLNCETQHSVLSTVQQEMASRRSKLTLNRQDSRLSVKTLIETIENNKTQPKEDEIDPHLDNPTSINITTADLNTNVLPTALDTKANSFSNEKPDSPCIHTIGANALTIPKKGPLREQPPQQQTLTPNIHYNLSKFPLSGERRDPLNMLAKNGGSKRNALLKWCQNKTVGYRNIDITNFSSSWNDGLAFCAILHSYLPDRISYDTLNPTNKRRNFSLAFAAAESVGIPTTLNINDMCQLERPDWTQVMSYVTAIYKHFET